MSVRAATTAGSLKRGVPLLVVSLLLGLATMASPALAARTHVFQGAIGAGELTAPAGLAVDSASGDLYVADPGSSNVYRFDAAGAPEPFTATTTNELGPFTFPEGAQQVAVDNSATSGNGGHFYVADGATVKAFDAAGEPAPFSATASYLSGNEITGGPTGDFIKVGSVAVGSEGDIYVSDAEQSVVLIYAPSGEYLTSITEELVVPFLAAPDSTGVVYAGYPVIEYSHAFIPSSNPPGSSTTFASKELSFLPGTGFAVEGGTNQVYSSNSPSPQSPTSITQYASFADGNGPLNTFGAEQLAAGVGGIAAAGSTGLSAGEIYVATGAQVDRFGPLTTVPDVVTETAMLVDSTSGSATLAGTVNPDGIPLTACAFDYGPTAAYGQSVECEGGPGAVGAGERPKPVTARLTGLAPGNYHFRLVAANANGPAAPSADLTFDTEAAPPAESCPNEALRIGASALLPECRAYEMVSPPDKNGGRVSLGYAARTAASGNAIQFESTSAFAGAEANSVNAYIARREGGNWTTAGIDAPQFNPGVILELTSLAASENLEKTLQWSIRAVAPGAVEGNVNLYLRDNATGVRTLIATHPQSRALDEEVDFEGGRIYGGGTPDWSRLFLGSKTALTPDAVEGETNYYEFADGRLKLVNLATLRPLPYEDKAGALASADGSSVYFAEAGSLYRYDVAGGTLTGLTTGPNPEVVKVVSVSEDGSRLYVEATGALTPDSKPAPPGTANLFAWHDGEFAYVATTTGDVTDVESGGFAHLEASPNGRFLGIGTLSPLTSADVKSAACPAKLGRNPAGYCTDVYVYEAESGRLTCISCSGAALGFSYLGSSEQKGTPAPRSVLNDGTVLFDSPNKLVPRDANGVGDVYDWRDGRERLISTGVDGSESNFAGATANGHDIFFRTSQRLVGQDTDAATDVYDARVDGGLPAQNPPGSRPPCGGQECRGSASWPPPPLVGRITAGSKHLDCTTFSKRAKHLREKAKRLKNEPAKAKAHKQAKRSTRKANQCRRQGK
jgi:hypothetical protein